MMMHNTLRHRVPVTLLAGGVALTLASLSVVPAYATQATAQQNGLVEKDGVYYFYRKNRLVRNSWKKINGRRYYFKANGAAATASCKVGKTYYVFDEKGRLFEPAKKTVKKVGDQVYCVKKGGKAVKGWHVIKKKVYYSRKNGQCAKNEKISYIRFNSKSQASNTDKAKAKIEAAKFIRKHTKKSWSKRKKFKACFHYIMANTLYDSDHNPPRFKKKNWQYRGAVDMFQNELWGNCFGISCSVAAVAKELGYKPTHIRLADHGYVIVNGKYFDNMHGAKFASSRRPAGKVIEKFKY